MEIKVFIYEHYSNFKASRLRDQNGHNLQKQILFIALYFSASFKSCCQQGIPV